MIFQTKILEFFELALLLQYTEYNEMDRPHTDPWKRGWSFEVLEDERRRE